MHTPWYNDFQKHIQRFPLTEMPDIVLRTAGNKTDSNKAQDTNVYKFMVTQRGGNSLCTFQPQPPTKQNTTRQPCDTCFFLYIFNAHITWASALQLLLILVPRCRKWHTIHSSTYQLIVFDAIIRHKTDQN